MPEESHTNSFGKEKSIRENCIYSSNSPHMPGQNKQGMRNYNRAESVPVPFKTT